MKLSVWGINYHPEPIGIAVYTTEMCEYLSKQGHDISVVTAFPYYPWWQRQQSGIYASSQVHGVKIKRNWLFVPRRAGVLGRILHELSFVLTSTLCQLLQEPPDAYIVVSPPLLLGLAAWFISVVKRRPFVFHIQDLQPDAAASLGMAKEGLLLSFARWIERVSYEKASRISVISQEMRENLLRKGVDPAKIFEVPNWIDCAAFDSDNRQGRWKQKYGVDPARPIVSYCGNHGVKQGLETIVEAARLSDGRSDALFVLCGEGAAKEQLETSVRESGVGNVLMFGVLDKEDHLNLLADSAVCLITLKPGTGASFLPSKLLAILAAGKPVATNADEGSALYAAVRQGRFGVVANGAREFAQQIEMLIEDHSAARDMSQSARAYVCRFDKPAVLSTLEDQLIKLLNESAPVSNTSSTIKL